MTEVTLVHLLTCPMRREEPYWSIQLTQLIGTCHSNPSLGNPKVALHFSYDLLCKLAIQHLELYICVSVGVLRPSRIWMNKYLQLTNLQT